VSRFSSCHRLAWPSFVFVLAGACVLCRVSWADEAPESDGARAADAAASAAADAVQDLLFCTPRRPLLIRLHLYVRGKSFRTVRRSWADALFAPLDTDRNGMLEGAERAGIPAPITLQNPGGMDHEQLAPADSDPADGKVSSAEFRRYLLAATGTPFSIEQTPESAAGQVDLFPVLDQNQDGKLSPEELRAAPEQLRRHDRDEDDILEATELLQAFPGKQAAAHRQLSGVLGLIAIVDPARGSPLARRLIEGYDKVSRDPVARIFRKDEQLSQAELAITPEEFGRADRNSDRRLDRGELARLAAVMEPAVELDIHIPAADGAFSITLVRPPPRELETLIHFELAATGQSRLVLNGTAFGLRGQVPPAGLAARLRETYLTNFRQIDVDHSEFVDAAESQRFGAPSFTFLKQADTDGDGRVDLAEYTARLDWELSLTASRVMLTVSSGGQSLFSLFDTNQDGRLGIRELREAPAHASKWDTDGDGFISRAELPVQLDAAFSAGTPRVNGPFGVIAGQTTNLPEGRPAGPKGGEAVPAWFTKMDTNGDGDITPKEFVGSRPLFDRFDKNRDGLISADEAIAALKKE
jgi:Ca2+-binding EF-hand superfamily protein